MLTNKMNNVCEVKKRHLKKVQDFKRAISAGSSGERWHLKKNGNLKTHQLS